MSIDSKRPSISPENEKPNKLLEDFWTEIDLIKRGEKDAGMHNLHDFSFLENPRELTEEDAKIWNLIKPENYKRGSITKEDLELYAKKVDASKNESRINFKGIINGKITLLWGRESIERK